MPSLYATSEACGFGFSANRMFILLFFCYFSEGSQALLLIDFLVFHSVFLFSFLTAFIIEKFPSWQAAKVILLFGHETIFRLENVQNILWGNVLPASVFTISYLCIFWANVLCIFSPVMPGLFHILKWLQFAKNVKLNCSWGKSSHLFFL